MTTIPVSKDIRINPGVISAGGDALVLNGVILTTSHRVPIGQAYPFSSQAAVLAFFGETSLEGALAGNYFKGFNNKTQTPSQLYFVQYAWAKPVSAYVRGVNVAALTLTQLQAITGVLDVTIDGVPQAAPSLTLSSATSFTNAAQIIQNALGITGPSNGSATGSLAAGVLTVTGTPSAVIGTNNEVTGTGVTTGTYIQAQLTSTAPNGALGAAGTYSVNGTQTVASEALMISMPAVEFDSVSGAFRIISGSAGTASTIALPTGSAAVLLGLSTGSLSQGAGLSTPTAAMNALLGVTQNWAAFTTTFEPVLSDKLAFAAWVNNQNDLYAYVPWDTDPNAIVPNNQTCFGYMVGSAGLNYDGIIPISGAAVDIVAPATLATVLPPIAVFVLGWAASLNFGAKNGRATLKYRGQSGLAASCSDLTNAVTLEANGYNYYGAFATANQAAQYMSPGLCSGRWLWADTYVNQIYLNSQLQLSLLELELNSNSLPYNQGGYNGVEAACLDDINAAINFGSIRTGVILSDEEAYEVNAAAGLAIDTTLTIQGYYLQILDPGAQVRAARGSPVSTLWYMDGGSIQSIALASVDVQ